MLTLLLGDYDVTYQVLICSFPMQVRSSIQQYGAHTQGTETSCLCFSHDNKTLVTRGGNKHSQWNLANMDTLGTMS